MTTRPVFIPNPKKPYYRRIPVEFEYNPGQAAAQKKKNVAALHEAYQLKNPQAKLLEVSTKSEDPMDQAASPFNLKLEQPYLKKSFPVENIYQAAKVFEQGGPYVDLLGTTPLQAKRDERLEKSGELLHYKLNETLYPSYPGLLFYAWLYVNALIENPKVAKAIMEADGFTDIEFNPAGEVCQALGCAIYKGLKQTHSLSDPVDFETFKSWFLDEDISEIKQAKPVVQARLPEPKVKKKIFNVGQWIDHPQIGKGEIMRKDARTYTIYFKVSGPKTIERDYVEKFCRLIK